MNIAALPEGWSIVELGTLGVFLKGSGIRKDEAQSGEIPAVRYGELYTDHQEILRSHRSFISQAVSKMARPIRHGDILFAGSGETKEEIGKCTGFLGDYEAFAGGDIIIFRPSGADPRFLAYLLNSRTIAQQKAQRAQGDAVVHIYPDALSALRLSLPPLPEQQVIAAALSDADGVVAGLERVIAKKRLIKQGAMQDLLTARRRLPGFSEEWKCVKLGACASVISKGTTPTSIGHAFVEHGINFIKVESLLAGRSLDLTKVAAISEATHSALKRSQLQAGDILISIAGAIGRVGMVDQAVLPANTNQALAFVRLHDRSALFPGFVPYILESEMVLSHWDEISVQGAQPNISLSDVRNLDLPCPPYAEQQAIAAVLSDMDAEIQSLESRLAKARAVKEGMMQNLLTGRVRLV